MERLFVFADFNWLGKAELVGELCYEKNCQNLGFRQESLSFSPQAAAMWAKSAMEKQGRMKGYGMDYSMKIVKEIYKSQVYCVKNKTFINFALENRR